MPKVSVLIPSYNTAQYLPLSIQSVLSQTYQDFEIIIIDDGSSDNTKDIVQTYIDKYPDKIKYVWQENQGVSMARNTGILNSQGEYLALLDADDLWLACRLEEGVKILDADPAVGLVHGNITRIDNNGKVISTPKRNPKVLNGFIFDNLYLRKAHISSQTALFRRSCCDHVGMFDVKLSRLGCEDRDLWLRIAQEYRIIFVDKVLSYYRVSTLGMSHNLKKMMEARYYVIDKYCHPDDQSKKRLRHRALAKIHREVGDEYLLKKDHDNARQEYQKAIKHDPLAFWPWVNWVKAVLKR